MSDESPGQITLQNLFSFLCYLLWLKEAVCNQFAPHNGSTFFPYVCSGIGKLMSAA